MSGNNGRNESKKAKKYNDIHTINNVFDVIIFGLLSSVMSVRMKLEFILAKITTTFIVTQNSNISRYYTYENRI